MVTAKVIADPAVQPGYMVDFGNSYIKSGSKYAPIEMVGKDTFKFTVPEGLNKDLDFTPAWAKEGEGFEINATCNGYTCPDYAKAGETVYIEADEGCAFDEVDYNTRIEFGPYSGNSTENIAPDLKLTKISNTKYSFVMPQGQVAVYVKTKDLSTARADTAIKNAAVTFDKKYYDQGETVKITIKPDAGYRIKDGSVVVKDASYRVVSVSGSNGSYTVTMPKSSYITVFATIEKVAYDVTVPYPPENGKITVSPAKAGMGDTVTITIAPDARAILFPRDIFGRKTATATT